MPLCASLHARLAVAAAHASLTVPVAPADISALEAEGRTGSGRGTRAAPWIRVERRTR